MKLHDIRKPLAGLLLGFWGLLLLNSIVFRHAHRLPDGRVISHAHPYKSSGGKGSYPGHSHTSAEYCWLDALVHATFDAPEPQTLLAGPTEYVLHRGEFCYRLSPTRQSLFFFSLRAPPALFC